MTMETKRIVPKPIVIPPEDEESLDVWGFKDTSFHINERNHVILSGSRYSLSGEELPTLLPWVQDILKINIDPKDIYPSNYPPQIPESRMTDQLRSALLRIITKDQISEDSKLRLRHSHGHTQEEMYGIKYDSVKRIPDAIVYPTSENEILRLVQSAKENHFTLIPYGGGTSVTHALKCPENETRPILSVDMKRMNRILWIDPVNRMACIEAGAVGRHITDQLARHGFTMGHEPDSVEFSTLGGWIATNASGMKKNKYGNIEDLILDVHVVTAHGKLERSSIYPRESVGIDPRLSLFGSEGTLGIITSAIVKLFPLPEVKHYGSILFPNFQSGVDFMYELAQESDWPASVRLVDNLQFQFSLALKPKSTGLHAIKSKIEKFFVTRIKAFNPQEMVACTLVFEGTREEVAEQEANVYAIGAKHGGMKAGSKNGERGYQLTFGIAYIRDFVMRHYILAESFETSVPWSGVISLSENVKRRIYDEHRKRNLPGTSFVTCRVTQIYETGACIYFYFGFYFKGVKNPSHVFHEIEEAAREEILKSGGSLSHHHGVGKLRRRFLKDIKSEATLDWIARTKGALDPDNIFGAGNQA